MLLDYTGDIFTWNGHDLKRGHGRPVVKFKEDSETLLACEGAALYLWKFLNDTGCFDEKFVSYLKDLDIGQRGMLLGHFCMFVASTDVLHKGHGSNLPTGDYIRFMTRNRLMLIGKNIPLSLLWIHFNHFLIEQPDLFIQYRYPLGLVMGYLLLPRKIQHVIHERRRFIGKKVHSCQKIDRLLDPSPEEVFFPRYILERIRRENH